MIVYTKFDLLLKWFVKTLLRTSRNCSIDEAVVGFKGRIGFKQYLPMKPTKRGYKIWVRAGTVNGYICDFRVYTGKDSGRPTSGLDLGEAVFWKKLLPFL